MRTLPESNAVGLLKSTGSFDMNGLDRAGGRLNKSVRDFFNIPAVPTAPDVQLQLERDSITPAISSDSFSKSTMAGRLSGGVDGLDRRIDHEQANRFHVSIGTNLHGADGKYPSSPTTAPRCLVKLEDSPLAADCVRDFAGLMRDAT